MGTSAPSLKILMAARRPDPYDNRQYPMWDWRGLPDLSGTNWGGRLSPPTCNDRPRMPPGPTLSRCSVGFDADSCHTVIW